MTRISRLHHEPQYLDKVWDERRIRNGLQPNGYVLRPVRENYQVVSAIVKFHTNTDNKFTRHEMVEYGIDELRGNWRGQHMGFMIHDNREEG